MPYRLKADGKDFDRAVLQNVIGLYMALSVLDRMLEYNKEALILAQLSAHM
jgi:hypothetical protein